MKKTIKKPNFAKKTYGGGRKSVIHKLYDKGLFSSNSNESNDAFKKITQSSQQNSPLYVLLNPTTRASPVYATINTPPKPPVGVNLTRKPSMRPRPPPQVPPVYQNPNNLTPYETLNPTPASTVIPQPLIPPQGGPWDPLSTRHQRPPVHPPTNIDYSDINLNGDKPNIEIFIGGGDNTIQNKIRKIYDKTGWVGAEYNSNMIFLFIQNKAKDKIVSIVRISNESIGDYAFELGYDYTLTELRRKKLYELLFIARLKYINDNNFKQIYVSYTEDDYLKNFQIRCGMTLIGNNKVKLSDGIQYWKLEFHSFKLAAITMNQCNGVYIGDHNNKGIILTAGHCVVDDSDFSTLLAINNLKNITQQKFTPDNNVDSLKNYFTRETSYKDISYFKVNEKIPNTYIYIIES